MLRSKWGLASIIIGYAAGYISTFFLHDAIALVFPILGTMLASVIRNAELKVARLAAERDAANAAAAASIDSPQPSRRIPSAQSFGGNPPGAQGAPAGSASAAPRQAAPESKAPELGPEWDSILEYIGTIEDMVLLEGKKDNLDNEIVQRTLSLLVRLNRVIPQLVAFNNGDINHKIQRLVLKDLNGAITPFLHLSGEAKRQNRRLLLNSIRDIDNQITTYTSFIEQKDLMELKNKAELIHQRYGAGN
ncbi:hypothetical protein [Cohnella cellulosilytica]|uniref:5-bromo-4-chloroindolyl phosphate hydrolysis protein n=1 Tax=Cohnella cellulosilytica TaxID=986710 RepID=A0ABW2FCJ2_9BACL